jgi:PadR family transcriptional regulator PadR
MTRNRRPSPQTIAVLVALAAEPETWRYGYELGAEVGLKAGSLYPILMRLSDRALLEATWETDPPTGRPPRHLYRLTPDGLALATELVTEQRAPAAPRPSRVPRTAAGLGRNAAEPRSAW